MNTSQERMHSLDSLRAMMMLLGVVFHAALPYRTMNGQAPEGQAFNFPVNTDIFFDRFTVVIHTFRMPVFFVIAGFFGAMLYYNHGSLYMIRNRINRIVWPFIASLAILFPVTMLLVSFRNHSEISWTEGLAALQHRLVTLNFSPFRTLHLWFLYYLFLITLAVWLMALLMKKFPVVREAFPKNFKKVLQRVWLRPVLFSFFTFVIFYFMGSSYLITPPDLGLIGPAFAMYLHFYLFGWLVFNVKDELPTFMQYDWLQVISGIALSLLHIWAVSHQVPNELQMVIKALSVWLFIFGLTGLFLRYLSIHSAKMRYLAEASYWIYIIHLPVVTLFHGVMAPLTLHVFLKFGLVVVTTFGVCVASYHYCVRSTIIGKFLNGKVYTAKSS